MLFFEVYEKNKVFNKPKKYFLMFCNKREKIINVNTYVL